VVCEGKMNKKLAFVGSIHHLSDAICLAVYLKRFRIMTLETTDWVATLDWNDITTYILCDTEQDVRTLVTSKS
jgi:hypothetical protein